MTVGADPDVPLLAHVGTTGSTAAPVTVLVLVSPLASHGAVEEEIEVLVEAGRRVFVADHAGIGGSDARAGSMNDWVDQVGGAVDATVLVAIGPAAGSLSELAALTERLEPRADGAHLAAAIDAVRSAWVFGPWHERTPAVRLRARVPNAAALHAVALCLLESPSTLAARGEWFEGLPAHPFTPRRVNQDPNLRVRMRTQDLAKCTSEQRVAALGVQRCSHCIRHRIGASVCTHSSSTRFDSPVRLAGSSLPTCSATVIPMSGGRPRARRCAVPGIRR